MNILDKIIEQKKIEIAERKSNASAQSLQDSELYKRNCFSLKQFLLDESKTGIIAEFKRQSPSKGIINDKADVVEFGNTNTTAWAYVWKAGKAQIMDITAHHDDVDDYCNQRTHSAEALRWKATCLKDHKTRPQAWKEVEPEQFQGYSDSPPPRAKVVGFDRRKYHMEEGLGGQARAVGAVLLG